MASNSPPMLTHIPKLLHTRLRVCFHVSAWPAYRGWWCTRIVLVDGLWDLPYWLAYSLRVTCQIRWLLAQVILYSETCL